MTDIDSNSSVIDGTEVRGRIEKLEESTGYDVVRIRTDEVIQDAFDSEDDASNYIDQEDYNRERVAVREAALDEDDQDELDKLRKLVDDVSVDSDWTLYNADYFDENWARDNAADTLNVPRYKLDDWPLDQIDWDEAAVSLRDSRYDYSYEFDGTTFYGDE